MALSPSGVATLCIVILIGPLFLGAYFLYKKLRDKREDSFASDQPNDGREAVNSSDYLFSLIGYSIGIANVWRFPYVISANGGGAALIAYLICAVFVAVPLFLFELVLGQHTRLSTIQCYEMIRPRWRSLGYAQGLMIFLGLAQYQIILSYACVYIMNACVEGLPWSEEAYSSTERKDDVTAAESFWENHVLNRYDPEQLSDQTSLGPIQWPLATALVAVWLMCFLAVAFGKSVLAKVTSVTVIAPVVLMFVLLVRAALLEGASNGIEFYIGKIEWSRLRDPKVWSTCCSQILFSLGPGFGTAITMSSYTRKKEDVFRACMIVAVSNSAFSIVGGFAIFSVVGHLAWRTGRTVAEVAERSGPGLAFITMADAMTYFGEGANVMAVLFFVMLLQLGLDSSFASLETCVSYVSDFLAQRKYYVKRWVVVLGVSLVLFLCGLPSTTRMGFYILDVVDHFAVTHLLLLCCFLEAVMISFDFTWERVVKLVKLTTLGNAATPYGRDLNPYFWRFSLYVSAPLASIFLWGSLVADDIAEPYGGYPARLLAVGWTILGLELFIIPMTLWQRQKGTLPPLSQLEPPSTPSEHSQIPTLPPPAAIAEARGGSIVYIA